MPSTLPVRRWEGAVTHFLFFLVGVFLCLASFLPTFLTLWSREGPRGHPTCSSCPSKEGRGQLCLDVLLRSLSAGELFAVLLLPQTVLGSLRLRAPCSLPCIPPPAF